MKNTSLGIELGSTKIKAVLIDEAHQVLARGSASWESTLENGYWTYSMEQVWEGMQTAFAELRQDAQSKGISMQGIGVIGVSAMMHGYLPFDAAGNQLAAFRTWRNATTQQAATELSELLECNIPLRWSIAHLDQASLNGEEHLQQLDFLTTLAGYVHWKLTGEKVLGVGDASGMFPIDPQTCDYDETLLKRYEARIAEYAYPWTLRQVLPKVLSAGETAGQLTEEGARLLDPSGALPAGIPFAPPEGDAGTGMVATNSVAPLTGNVSAGTSIFSMVVLDRPLSKAYPELDVVTTPDGAPVAMVHCNNGTADMNAWVGLFRQVLELFQVQVEPSALYEALYRLSLQGEPDCAGTVVFNHVAAEPILGLTGGAPMVLRQPGKPFMLADFLRAQLFACLAPLQLGMQILHQEQITPARLTAHGGMFTTPGVAQNYMAAAFGTTVDCMKSAEEGGAYGIALLGAYAKWKTEGQSLAEYLQQKVFVSQDILTVEPDAAIADGFAKYLDCYLNALAAEKCAVLSQKEE